MLDLLEAPLRARRYRFVRLDGRMAHAEVRRLSLRCVPTHEQRVLAVNQFNGEPDVRVFLISVKAGGLGLNLTAASRVFLLDPWWNRSPLYVASPAR